MTDAHNVDERLTQLEIKSSFMEDLVDKLDQIVIRQQNQIDLLTREVLRLRQSDPADKHATTRTLSDDLPPHY